MRQAELFELDEDCGNPEAAAPPPAARATVEDFHRELRGFQEFGESTRVESMRAEGIGELPVYINEFWTAKQRQAHSLHEISYRACFKPQLPAFFIRRFTAPAEVVYDPFMGRGTTPLEAALLGRIPRGCDINPVSVALVAPRIDPPLPDEVRERVAELPLATREPLWDDLLAFYHPKVLEAVTAMRAEFSRPALDRVDAWLKMVATNRLAGHSGGFFSVYSMPPNQAVSVKSQLRINERRSQVPPERDVRKILIRKSDQLMRNLTAADRIRLAGVAPAARFVTGSCDSTPDIPSDSVDLVVTSPPFLNEVDYRTDNWLRCWFHGIDSADLPIWQVRRLDDWRAKMTGVFRELHRVLRPGGIVAFEVGEVRGGTVTLEESVAAAGCDAGLRPELVMINAQKFTKTSNCWGVSNRERGTNTNRIVLLRKPAAGPG